jgi:hypothetical protein
MLPLEYQRGLSCAYSPEFNAAEPLRKYTRKTGTHNRYYETEDEIVDTLKKVFQGIQCNPEK